MTRDEERSPLQFSPGAALRGGMVLVALALVLSTLPVGHTRVSLNVTAELAALVAGEGLRVGELVVDDLVWQGAESAVELPGGILSASEYLRVERGPITVPETTLPPGGSLVVQAETGSDRFQLSFSGADGRLEIALPRGARVQTGDGTTVVSEGEFGALTVEDPASPFHVTATRLRRERLLESAAISSLGFWREDASLEGGTPLSTVRSGVLVLEDVGGRSIELREGEPLSMGRLEGVVRSLVLEDGLIHVQFDGRVRGLRSGYGTDARSLMPNMLDRLAHVPQVRALMALAALLLSLPIRIRLRTAEIADAA